MGNQQQQQEGGHRQSDGRPLSDFTPCGKNIAIKLMRQPALLGCGDQCECHDRGNDRDEHLGYRVTHTAGFDPATLEESLGDD